MGMISRMTDAPAPASGPASEPVTTPADLHARQLASQQRIMAVQQKALAARATLQDTTVTKSSQDHSVTLTVNPGGGLVRIQFGPAAEKKALSQLATTVMQTYQAAAAEAVAVTIGVMREVTGGDSTALDVLRANVPAEIVEEDS